MVWIVKTKDNKIHKVDNKIIGYFTQNNEVIECQLKR